MLCALTPLGKVAQSRKKWLVAVANFTIGGLVASVLIAAAVAWLGATLAGNGGLARPGAAVCVALVGLLAAGREAIWPRLPLIEPRRATNDRWARRWGLPCAALLWGADIGLYVTTWFTFAGAWIVIVIACASGAGLFAAALFAAYWLGRAATVWLGPWFVPDATMTPSLPNAWRALHRPYQLLHAATVVVCVILVAATAILA